MENRAGQRALTMSGALIGSYRITGMLASGGMGQVFKAKHELLDKPAAVKVLRAQFANDEDLVQRFSTEAKATAAIKHPGVIEIFDFGFTDEGHAYLAMELLEGISLGAYLKQKGALPEPEAANIARGIASALVAAHGKGIVHRDLKPDNVFLVDGVRPKVLDFGIAKLVEAGSGQTQTGALLGTPLYMAPEQARAARAIDHRADLYSLGCILYEMLAGKPPFTGDGAGELIAMHMFTDPEPIGGDLGPLVMKLLAKEPADRCQTAQEVVDALGKHSAVVTAVVPAAMAPEASLKFPKLILPENEAPPTFVDPGKKNRTIPIVAGVFTVGLVVALVAFVATRGGGNDAQANPSPSPSPIVETPRSTPPKPTEHIVAAPKRTEETKETKPAQVIVKQVPAQQKKRSGSSSGSDSGQPHLVTTPTLDPPTTTTTTTTTNVITQPKLETPKGSPAENGQLPDP